MTRWVAVGAVVAFALTIGILSVWTPRAAAGPEPVALPPVVHGSLDTPKFPPGALQVRANVRDLRPLGRPLALPPGVVLDGGTGP